jgi:membrane fusion protein, multidrug efflux system
MNPSEYELRNKGLRSRSRNVGQASQPVGGDCTSSLPSSVEEARAQAQDGSPSPAPGWWDRSLQKPPIDDSRSDTVHKEVQRQDAAASPRALEGRQRVAQGERGQESLAPPWVKSSKQFSPLPLSRPLSGDSGGEAGRWRSFVANWRGSRFFVPQRLLSSKCELGNRARSRPLTPALSPNTKSVLREREKTRRLLTQGRTSGSCRPRRPGLQADAPLGLHKEEAASCRFTNVLRLASYAAVCPCNELNRFRFPSPQGGRGVRGEGESTWLIDPGGIQTQTWRCIPRADRRYRNPPHPQPLSRVGARGAESIVLRQHRREESPRHKTNRTASLPNFSILAKLCLLFLLCTPLLAQTSVECVHVISKSIERQVRLPGELSPYLSVPIYARVAGFVDRVQVDRGSLVKKGQVLATLVAPETEAQIAEAISKGQAIQLQRAEAAAKLSAAQSTYDRLKAASQTPGVVAGNDLVVAEKNVEAAQALVNSYEGSIKAAEASVESLKALEKYLTLTAPFDGIITDRTVHPGTLAGPNSGTGAAPLLRLEQLNRLRLTVAVPEAQVGGIVKNARVPFTLPAFPGETFHGVVRRIAHALEPKTRTMAVELDVANPNLRLASGMYADVQWPVRKARPALLVPPTSIATTTERAFVIRIKNDLAEWVTVSRGAAAGDLVEIHGALQDGDLIARRGTDELREGARVKVTLPAR